MAHKLLSITRQQDRLRGIVIEKKGGGYFAGEPMDLSSREALSSACRTADEIYVNDSFLSAVYVWDLFPKVAAKHLPDLLYQDALEKFRSQGDPNVGFQLLDEVQAEDVRRQEIAYVAVEEEEIVEVWAIFKTFSKKIKGITPLPVSLAGAVAKFEALESNFVVIWIGDAESVITIASQNGLVKVARNLPFGTKGVDFTDEEAARIFAQKIDRELNRTINFFKQGFREPEPDKVYLFGNSRLKSTFEATPLSVLGAEYFFQPATPLINNYSPESNSENFHIVSSLFLNDNFNYLPKKVVADKKSKKIFYPACAAVTAAIIALFFWHTQLNARIGLENAKLMQRHDTAMALKGEVEALEKRISKLKPFQGWKVFYDQTFNDKLAWNKIFSALGSRTPSHVVLDSLSINPGGRGQWLANVSGKIRAPSWEVGLVDLRKFGAKIDSSPFFMIKNINYAPQNLEEKSKFFNFKLLLELNKMEP